MAGTTGAMLNTPTQKGQATRDRLLEAAELAVLAKGIAATSIEELIAAAGVTRSSFFYYFKDKAELAKALILRYIDRDQELLDELCRRADELHEDPLHAFLVGLKMFSEMMAELPDVHPGLLAASIAYQDHLFNREIKALNAKGVLAWRQRFRERFDRIVLRHPLRRRVDLDQLADMAATIVHGGIVLGRALGDRTILPNQVLLYRDYVSAVFAPDAALAILAPAVPAPIIVEEGLCCPPRREAGGPRGAGHRYLTSRTS